MDGPTFLTSTLGCPAITLGPSPMYAVSNLRHIIVILNTCFVLLVKITHGCHRIGSNFLVLMCLPLVDLDVFVEEMGSAGECSHEAFHSQTNTTNRNL